MCVHECDESAGLLLWSAGSLAFEPWAWAQTVCKLEKLAQHRRRPVKEPKSLSPLPSSSLPHTLTDTTNPHATLGSQAALLE